MLPRSRRVSKTLFESSMRNGKSFHSSFLSLKIGSNNGKPSLFSCVVSKKVDKRAVGRNALRRNIYEILGKIMPEIKSGYVAVFFTKKGCENLSLEDLNKETVLLLDRSGLRTA